MMQMFVAGIGLEGRANQPIVLLQDEGGQRGVPIAVSAGEARAIAKAMQRAQSKRPDIYDLLNKCVETFGYTLQHIFIEYAKPNSFRSTIAFTPAEGEWGSGVLEVDANPADAITLALNNDSPIMLSDDIIKLGSVVLKNDEQQAEQFKDFVKDLKASDFNKFGGGPVELP